MNDENRRPAPAVLAPGNELDCPICGLGFAFSTVHEYDVCPRCEWTDDPAAHAEPERKCDTNDESLTQAQRSWPRRLVTRLSEGPVSTFGITRRDDKVGGYDYLVDGVSIRALVPGGRMDLKASIGPWPARGDWFAPLRTGKAQNQTARPRLYVCHVCGDENEPAITADIHVGAERVIWSRVGFEEYNYGPPEARWELDLRRGPAGFAFDAAEYQRVLTETESSSR